MRTTISALAVAAAACGGDLGDGGEADSSLLALGRTPGGALYHAANCLPQDERARLVTFAPGTGLTPDHYQLFVEHLGNASGLCVVAVQYENTRLAAACCTTTETPDGLQDPDCLLRLLSAKSASEPERMTCTDGSLLSVPSARSVEGAILEALDHLGMTAYLTEDGNEVLWDRLKCCAPGRSSADSSSTPMCHLIRRMDYVGTSSVSDTLHGCCITGARPENQLTPDAEG